MHRYPRSPDDVPASRWLAASQHDPWLPSPYRLAAPFNAKQLIGRPAGSREHLSVAPPRETRAVPATPHPCARPRPRPTATRGLLSATSGHPRSCRPSLNVRSRPTILTRSSSPRPASGNIVSILTRPTWPPPRTGRRDCIGPGTGASPNATRPAWSSVGQRPGWGRRDGGATAARGAIHCHGISATVEPETPLPASTSCHRAPAPPRAIGTSPA
jgi:hypothetical protein